MKSRKKSLRVAALVCSAVILVLTVVAWLITPEKWLLWCFYIFFGLVIGAVSASTRNKVLTEQK